MTARIGNRGFTLIELMVVMGMLMLLAAAITSSITGANKRAKIQQAKVEAQEMTKAILAYENYGKDYSLDKFVRENFEATESSLSFILGGESMQNQGQSGKIPVLFNASTRRDGKILDPWGRPYYVTIRKDEVDQKDKNKVTFKSYVAFPNYNRRPASDLKEWAEGVAK